MPDPRLETAYRRLIYVYPSSYRRERGLEILTTLLDAARPGQRRPHWRDALDLLAGGIRARFTIPPGRFYSVVAAIVAVFIGLSVSAFTARTVWSQATLAPDHSTALALADQITGLAHVDTGVYTGDIGITYMDWMGKGQLTPPRYEGFHGQPPSPGATLASYTPQGDPVAYLAAARSRLAAQGWAAGELTTWKYGTAFWAGKDGYLVRLAHEDSHRYDISVRVHVHEPGIVTVAAITGLLVGTLAGWLVASWAMRRFAVQTPVIRTGMLFMGVPAYLSAACLVTWSLIGSGMTLWHWGWSQRGWLMTATALDEAFVLTVLVYSALTISLLLSAWQPARKQQAISITAFVIFLLITAYAVARLLYLPGHWW